MSQLIVNATIDDTIYCTASTFANARTSSTGTIYSSPTINMIGVLESLGSTLYGVYRVFYTFDTSDIGANNYITSASLYMYFNLYTVYHRTFNIIIQNGQPTYPHSPLSVNDFNYLNYQGSCDGGSRLNTSIIQNQYNDISLNSNGLLWINKTDITKFCIRTTDDIDGNAPTTDMYWYAELYNSRKGVQYTPYLTINYEPITPITYFNMNF